MCTLLWAEYRKLRRSNIVWITIFATVLLAIIVFAEGQGMQRHQPCSRHTNTSLIQFSRLSFLALVLLWFLCSGLLPSVFIQTVTDRRLFLLGQRILLPCLGEK